MPWGAWFCLILAGLSAWWVVHLTAQKSLFAGRLASEMSGVEVPDWIGFLEDHMFVAVVSAVAALLLWAMFRRPRSH